jgi:hypothetical protein
MLPSSIFNVDRRCHPVAAPDIGSSGRPIDSPLVPKLVSWMIGSYALSLTLSTDIVRLKRELISTDAALRDYPSRLEVSDPGDITVGSKRSRNSQVALTLTPEPEVRS